jgi:hypothetical protein
MARYFQNFSFQIFGSNASRSRYALSLSSYLIGFCKFPVLSFFLIHTVSFGQPSRVLGELEQVSEIRAYGCPDLSGFYQKSANFNEPEESSKSWAALAAELIVLTPSCLRSSEYFALLGAAQLNSGENARAVESLERSLLLDPEGRAARVDYAGALYSVGQLFPALEISEGLLAEEEVPPELLLELRNRNRLWRSETRQNAFYLDVGGGYDSNLNGAPNVSEINLTLSGEEVALSLDQAFQSTNGGYSNLRVANQLRILAPDHQQDWSNEIRGRVSEDRRSDLLRFDSRYSFLKESRSRNWRIDTAVTHLIFGSSSLFSAAQLSGRYQFSQFNACKPAVELAGQRQYFRQQLALNGIEGKLAGRIQCDLSSRDGRSSRITAEVGALRNYSLRSARPGGDREGWQALLQWQSGGVLVQASQTHLDDRAGYSPLLIGGAKRWINRSQVVLQYRRPIRTPRVAASWFINFFHQDQESNINLFTARDTSVEFGLGFVF